MQLEELVEPLWRVAFVPEQLMQLFCSNLGWYDRLLHGTQGFRPVFEKVPGWQGSEKVDKDFFPLNVKQYHRKFPFLKTYALNNVCERCENNDQNENLHLNIQVATVWGY